MTPHFLLSEFTTSQYAARHGIMMTPPGFVRSNLTRLCKEVLEPLRARLPLDSFRPRVIRITSGYRPKPLNDGIGGARNSAHLTGRAADFIVPGLSAHDVGKLIQESELAFDKAIVEFGRWVHVQVSADPGTAPRRRMLQAVRGRSGTEYLVLPE